MKKLLVLLTVLCLILAACCGGNQPVAPETEQGCQKSDKKCCKEMTEEQKQECAEFKAKWDDWANLTDDVKQDLIVKRKFCFDKRMEDMKEAEAKMQAHKAKMEEKFAAWETMTLDEQKEFFDECDKHCIKVKTKEGCCKSKEGKEGCGKHEKGKGCGKHEEGKGCGKHKEKE